jgi:hypothetical protein
MILECSSRGDIRFSAFYAEIKLFNKLDSIENFYQLSKRFGNKIPKSWRESKGKKPTHFNVNGFDYDVSLLGQWYKVLWTIYLDKNPNLIEYASSFSDYRDTFKGKSVNCQADVIRQYIRQGRDTILEDCRIFLEEVGRNNRQLK